MASSSWADLAGEDGVPDAEFAADVVEARLPGEREKPRMRCSVRGWVKAFQTAGTWRARRGRREGVGVAVHAAPDGDAGLRRRGTRPGCRFRRARRRVLVRHRRMRRLRDRGIERGELRAHPLRRPLGRGPLGVSGLLQQRVYSGAIRAGRGRSLLFADEMIPVDRRSRPGAPAAARGRGLAGRTRRLGPRCAPRRGSPRTRCPPRRAFTTATCTCRRGCRCRPRPAIGRLRAW